MAHGREDDWILPLLHSSSLLFNRSFYVKVSIVCFKTLFLNRCAAKSINTKESTVYVKIIYT